MFRALVGVICCWPDLNVPDLLPVELPKLLPALRESAVLGLVLAPFGRRPSLFRSVGKHVRLTPRGRAQVLVGPPGSRQRRLQQALLMS